MSRVVELLRLFNACGSITGRKKLQKMVFILKELGHPLLYRYAYHLHGVFSVELKAEIDTLVAQELIEQREDDKLYGEFRQYKYTSTARSWTILQALDRAESPMWADLAKKLNARLPQDLEAISTIMFLEKQGCADPVLKWRFEQLKPQLASKYDSSKRFIAEIRSSVS